MSGELKINIGVSPIKILEMELALTEAKINAEKVAD